MNHEEEEEEEDNNNVPRCDFDFSHVATLSSASSSSDVIGSIEPDPTNCLLATAGIARKIRIYTLPSYDYQYYICTPAKLSCLRWHPISPCSLLAADYDGVVTDYDISRRVPVGERDDHSGRRVWSVDYSPSASLAASGSDDGNASLWDPRIGSAIAGRVNIGAAVCSVEFEKSEGNYLGIGCADKRAYLYDLRRMGTAVGAMEGHERTVTYVRFDGEKRMVTSSTDGSHRLWDGETCRERRVYRGHVKGRSFVGMGVWRKGGLIGSGSESREVYVYDLRWDRPVWVGPVGGGEGFVSAVSWREVGEEDECELVAGGSDGVLHVFSGKRR